ncbi:hypothetical protein GCM10027405_05500 [Arthrobacter alkaliphilus]
MAVSRDGRIKVEDGKVFERVDSDAWIEIGKAGWAASDFVFVSNDPARVHPLEQPVGLSEQTLADSVSRFILPRS